MNLKFGFRNHDRGGLEAMFSLPALLRSFSTLFILSMIHDYSDMQYTASWNNARPLKSREKLMHQSSSYFAGTEEGRKHAHSSRPHRKKVERQRDEHQGPRPNIVIFMADDLGRSDVSFTEGSLQTPTPNIDKYAWDGIILDRHYVSHVCSPSRASFMTGKYPFQIGMQTGAIPDGYPYGVPLHFKFQPEYFKELGYSTYAIGKWHLGAHTREYFPNARGFDDWFGFACGDTNYFNYTAGWYIPAPVSGRALRQNGKSVPEDILNGWYSSDMFTAYAEHTILIHNISQPFYMYFSSPTTHTGFENQKAVVQTTPEYDLRPVVASFPDTFPGRKKQLGLVQAMDESFRRIIQAIEQKQLLDNTIIVFLSDNGASVPANGDFVHGHNFGSNWPLRHGKGSLFEGGIRSPAFIWSRHLPRRGYVYKTLFHISDWLPTLFDAAGSQLTSSESRQISGVSHWKAFLLGSGEGPRNELVNNIDTLGNSYSMTMEGPTGNLYKLIGGNVMDNTFLGWYPTEGTSEYNRMVDKSPLSLRCFNPDVYSKLGMELLICVPHKADCLFELTSDPCEQANIAVQRPDIVRLLKEKLKVYNRTGIPAANRPFDPKSNPDFFGGLWVPWLDEHEIMDRVPMTFDDHFLLRQS